MPAKCPNIRQYNDGSGNCRECDDYKIPTKDFAGCTEPPCDKYEKITKRGTCERCGRGTKPDPTNPKECIPLKCPSEHHKWNQNGLEC